MRAFLCVKTLAGMIRTWSSGEIPSPSGGIVPQRSGSPPDGAPPSATWPLVPVVPPLLSDGANSQGSPLYPELRLPINPIGGTVVWWPIAGLMESVEHAALVPDANDCEFESALPLIADVDIGISTGPRNFERRIGALSAMFY